MNDGEGAAPAKKSSTGSQSSPPASSRGSAPQVTPGPAQNGAYAGGGPGYGHPRPGQATPLYGPPSASIGPPGQPQSRGLTPLQTSSHAPGGGQYPFPQQQQPAQSPVSAQPRYPPLQMQQQYRPYDAHSATTPGARPPSHGFAQPSPSAGQFSRPHNAHPSLSPTPSSHHSQTPHSMRQSPMAMMGHPPPQQPPPPHHYHSSQPSTPLGPPQLPQRHSNPQLDMTSPYHSRTFSGTSNGMMTNSPAHHHQSIGQAIASPAAYSRPSPQQRRTSDHYRTSLDHTREKSESVSPKTQPRPPSLGSRQSSQQEVHSARSSLQPGVSVAPHPVIPNHGPTHSHAQPQPSYSTSEVSQASLQTSSSWPAQPVNGNSLSQPDNKIPLQHQHQKMPMSHLLAPTSHAQQQHHQAQNGGLTQAAPPTLDTAQSQNYSRPSPAPSAVSSRSHEQSQGNIKQEQPLTPASSVHYSSQSQSEGVPGHRLSHQRSSDMSASEAAEARPPLKRPADSESVVEPPAKRGRIRKHRERPIWAHLHPSNPRSREFGIAPNSREVSAPRVQQAPPQTLAPGQDHDHQVPQQPNGQLPPQLNGASDKPWDRNPPLDDDLLNARHILGMPWEKSIDWNKPLPQLNTVVADWLFHNFRANADIGRDVRRGTIEIEAKVGTLRGEDGNRFYLPIQNACVLHPKCPVNFETKMNADEHKHMNQFLNEATERAAKEPGRQKLQYKHTRETDSFEPLSKAGHDLLPDAAHRNAGRRGRELSLRTTTENKTGSVVARIVKVKIA